MALFTAQGTEENSLYKSMLTKNTAQVYADTDAFGMYAAS